MKKHNFIGKTWGCPFFETSALDSTNIPECFYEVVRQIRKERQQNEMPVENTTNCQTCLNKGCVLM